MDTVTQIALGAAVAEVTIGRKVGNKAILWGAIAGTLPDLDVFVPLGGAVRDFTYHRSATHSLFLLALAAPLLAWLITKIHPGTREHRGRWTLAILLVLLTHPLLDSFTAYGTQILWPISETPVAWSTIFIIDPLYTLPLLIGVIAALVMTREIDRGHRLARYGLIASTAYLAWTVAAKFVVDGRIEAALERQGIAYERIFTVPAPFNSLLWRAVVRDGDGYYEAYYSILDGVVEPRFNYFPSDEALVAGLEGHWPVARLKWFSKGFYSVRRIGDAIVISDLRMGVEPNYVFRFKVGETGNPHPRPTVPEQLTPVRDWDLLPRVWQRIWDPAVSIGPKPG